MTMLDRLKNSIRPARRPRRPDPVEEAYLDGVYAAWEYARELVENGEHIPHDPPATLHVRPTRSAA